MNREQRHAHDMISVRSRRDAHRHAAADARRDRIETLEIIGGGLAFLALIWIVLTLC